FVTSHRDHASPARRSTDLNPFRDYMINAEWGIDVLEDMIDTFWENPLAFAFMVHDKYREPMLDVFSGRIYKNSLHKGRDEAMVRSEEHTSELQSRENLVCR